MENTYCYGESNSALNLWNAAVTFAPGMADMCKESISKVNKPSQVFTYLVIIIAMQALG